MPSLPRYALLYDRATFHVTWQCHNKDWLLESSWAKKRYYFLLLKYKTRYKVRIYSYCFMSSHPHITGFCENARLLSDFFRIVNSLFARAFNKENKRRGQVVMDRFKSPIIETDADLLKVMAYVDLNPVRAKMVPHPKRYAWSSFKYYAFGKKDPLITPAPSYLKLGRNPWKRRKVYRQLIEAILKNDWAQKKPYSSIAFIGSPDWVILKTEGLKEERRKRLQRWREKFHLKFKAVDFG